MVVVVVVVVGGGNTADPRCNSLHASACAFVTQIAEDPSLLHFTEAVHRSVQRAFGRYRCALRIAGVPAAPRLRRRLFCRELESGGTDQARFDDAPTSSANERCFHFETVMPKCFLNQKAKALALENPRRSASSASERSLSSIWRDASSTLID
jgi:hypothetical protein